MAWTLYGVCGAVCCDPLMEALRVTGGPVMWFGIQVTIQRCWCSRIHWFQDTFIFRHETGQNVDSVSVVGYDDEDTDRGRCGAVMWFCSRSHDTKASVVQDPKVSGHYFVFQHRASRNVDSVSMVGYDNDCSLARTEEPSDCAKSCKNVWLQNLRCSLLLPSVRRAFRRSRHQTPWGDPALAYLECSRIVWDIPEPERQRELNKSLLSIS